MSRPDVLVVEISGKRPGTSKQRPTERYDISYDHMIISNNSEGYESDWDIVNVPEDYVEWYKANVKSSDSAWYAPIKDKLLQLFRDYAGSNEEKVIMRTKKVKL